jgi:hypothetical protein
MYKEFVEGIEDKAYNTLALTISRLLMDFEK